MSLPPNQIIDTVAMLRSIPRHELIGESRSAVVVAARHELHAAMRDLTQLSFAKIGQLAGGKDYTCIVSSISRVEKLRQADPEFRERNDALLRYLREMEPEAQAKAALGDGACCIAIARQAVCHPAGLTLPEVHRMGIALLTISSVLVADHITDAEARRAAQAVLTSTTSLKKGA